MTQNSYMFVKIPNFTTSIVRIIFQIQITSNYIIGLISVYLAADEKTLYILQPNYHYIYVVILIIQQYLKDIDNMRKCTRDFFQVWELYKDKPYHFQWAMLPTP